MSEEVIIILDAEMGEEVVELGEEKVYSPEISVAVLLREVGGITAAKLVVHYYWDLVRGDEVADREEVVVWDAWAAVETDERPDAGFKISEDSVPLLLGQN